MKPTRNNSVSPAAPGPAVRRTWVLGPLAFTVPVSFVLAPAGAGSDWIGAVWLAAVLWAIAASFVQALWQGLRHRDWSAFTCCDLPRNDDDLDFSTRTGRYAHLRIRADQEALMRDGDRFLEDHDHNDSRP